MSGTRAVPYPDSIIAALGDVAGHTPDAVLLRVGERSFTYAEALANVSAVAAGIRSLGIEPGERVGIMAPNAPETVWSWLATNAAQAVDVHFNADARGAFLAYLVADAGPRMLIGTAEFLQRLAECGATAPEFAICIGPDAGTPFGAGTRHMSFGDLLALSAPTAFPEPGPGEIATIMYTSGTTGASKGVMLPHRYYLAQASLVAEVTGLSRGETIYCVQPLFHIDARVYFSAALLSRATIALGVRFSARNFWNEVRRYRADVLGAIGTMIWILYKQPPSPSDRDHSARLINSSSTPREIHREFEQRFGVEIIEGYGMTESAVPTITRRGHNDVGSVGWCAPFAEIRLVDDDDRPVAPGAVGELIWRHKGAFTMMQGYWGRPVETVAAWRNLWFHSGDLLRARGNGQFEYVGRKKDSIRRRGENISAWEVEQAITRHREVLEAAVFGVASDVGEEDVAALVVRAPETTVDEGALHAFVRTDLPEFAVPRYIEFVDALPKTPSERIAKGEVRARGITSSAWDADSARVSS